MMNRSIIANVKNIYRRYWKMTIW